MTGAEMESSIAIIGMSGRFPGAQNVREFWTNVREGRESILPLSDEMLRKAGVDEVRLADPQYVKAAPLIAGLDLFDYTFFDMSKREADMLDPQHRFLLMCAYEALEDGGYASDRYSGEISVFAGCGFNGYLFQNILAHPENIAEEDLQLLLQTNSNDYASTRISYKLNLRGISVNVQSACSTSLLAVHQACQNLLMYQSDMALAGGGSLRIPDEEGYMYREGGIFSPDGHCRAFDADARGTVFGSGAGMVLLKRLEDALKDHDHIYAVIRGSAANNDGSGKVGYTAPSVRGQRDVIVEALAIAGITPDTIDYIEAHGTGTPLGDPIEIAALQEAFGERESGRCAIGSVKTNIGHLNAASGIAGLIKTAWMLEQREIPPSLHYCTPNPAIDFDKGPFYVNTRLRSWDESVGPRRAGVSSFGIGGTNVHVVLEEAPRSPREDSGKHEVRPVEAAEEVLLVSAKTPDAAGRLIDSVESYLLERPNIDKAAAAFTLQTGRSGFAHRQAALWDRQGGIQRIGQRKAPDAAPGVIFMFPGQGSQYVGMAAGLYDQFPLFRTYADECFHKLNLLTGKDYGALLLDRSEGGVDPAELQRTSVAQPLLFVVEYALAKCLVDWGIRPAAMIGHSLGEYTAACMAGAVSLEDALALIAERGFLMEQTPAGGMMAVFASNEQIEPLLSEGCSLSAVNSKTSCTVAGEKVALDRLAVLLQRAGIEYRLLEVNHGFHSSLMDSALEPFGRAAARCKWTAPNIPFASNVTGDFITDEQTKSAEYWRSHLRSTVQFARGIDTLLRGEPCLWLEVGPGRTLSQFVLQQSVSAETAGVYSLLPRRQEQASDRALLLKGLAQCWLSGITVQWERLHDPATGRIPLPTYPFEGKRCWFHSGSEGRDEPADRAEEQESSIRSHISADYIPPEDGVQEKLVQVWEQVLGVKPIGIRDDFFELGGHSLLATQIISRLRNLFPQIDFRFDRLFAYTTIEEIAGQIEIQMIEYLENQV
ncbi:type I polyketide synthase [Paenibacillus sp. M1]|uniref:Type I polyketide synthase n=1 Tax=Paenibacillus haidiansis TaxID=1574488 RepID=A0ABU7VP31_9BACL